MTILFFRFILFFLIGVFRSREYTSRFSLIQANSMPNREKSFSSRKFGKIL